MAATVGAVGEVRIEGLQELQRALRKINKDVAGEVRDALRKAGEPVRATAESYAFGSIRNIGNIWGEMRLGVAARGAYIVPATRRSEGSPRKAFGPLLLDKAMLPALERHQAGVLNEVTEAFDSLAFRAGFH